MPEEVEDENVSGTRDAARVRRIGEYDLLASLGRGGAGEVSLALRRGPHDFRKLVVIKLLHAHFQEDPEAVVAVVFISIFFYALPPLSRLAPSFN